MDDSGRQTITYRFTGTRMLSNLAAEGLILVPDQGRLGLSHVNVSAKSII